jgi:hypothetical protein
VNKWVNKRWLKSTNKVDEYKQQGQYSSLGRLVRSAPIKNEIKHALMQDGTRLCDR